MAIYGKISNLTWLMAENSAASLFLLLCLQAWDGAVDEADCMTMIMSLYRSTPDDSIPIRLLAVITWAGNGNEKKTLERIFRRFTKRPHSQERRTFMVIRIFPSFGWYLGADTTEVVRKNKLKVRGREKEKNKGRKRGERDRKERWKLNGGGKVGRWKTTDKGSERESSNSE